MLEISVKVLFLLEIDYSFQAGKVIETVEEKEDIFLVHSRYFSKVENKCKCNTVMLILLKKKGKKHISM